MVELELSNCEAEEYILTKVFHNQASLLTCEVVEQIGTCVHLLNNYCVPGFVSRENVPLFKKNLVHLKDTEFNYTGADIYKHLSGCDKVYSFVATLGHGIDRIIKTYQLTDMSLSYYLDALAGLFVEKLCDFVCRVIAKKEVGKDITQRFSCGYGDFPLDTQKDILKLLDAEKQLGVTLSEGGMMIPFKTVTAVLGVGKKGEVDRCAICAKRYDCKGDVCSD